MCAQGSGSIINTGSVAEILAGYSSIVYSAAKRAPFMKLLKAGGAKLGQQVLG